MNTTFQKLAIGSVFRALSNDTVPTTSGVDRLVENNSVYVKVGHNVSVDLVDGKDCIFLMEMQVRPVRNNNVNVSLLPSYKICNGVAA